MVKPIDITVRMFKHNGFCYRHHSGQLLAQTHEGIVLFSPSGTDVWDHVKPWKGRFDIYSYCWFDRWYNVLEVFDLNGDLVELYAHIASSVTFANGVVSFTDYELDVVKMASKPGPPELVDEDEFAEAAQIHGYSAALQQRCYDAAAEAMDLLTRWQVRLPAAQALRQSPQGLFHA